MGTDSNKDINTTISISQDNSDYIPPIKIYFDKDDKKHIKYVPFSFQKGFLDFKVAMTQFVYSNGDVASLYVNLNIDNERDKIKSRGEILDI